MALSINLITQPLTRWGKTTANNVLLYLVGILSFDITTYKKTNSQRRKELPMANKAYLRKRTYTIQLQYLDAALQWLYLRLVLEDPQRCIQRSFLTTLNTCVDELNDVVLQQLPGIAGNNTNTLLLHNH